MSSVDWNFAEKPSMNCPMNVNGVCCQTAWSQEENGTSTRTDNVLITTQKQYDSVAIFGWLNQCLQKWVLFIRNEESDRIRQGIVLYIEVHKLHQYLCFAMFLSHIDIGGEWASHRYEVYGLVIYCIYIFHYIIRQAIMWEIREWWFKTSLSRVVPDNVNF